MTDRAALVEKVARAMEKADSHAYEYQLTSSWEHLAEAAIDLIRAEVLAILADQAETEVVGLENRQRIQGLLRDAVNQRVSFDPAHSDRTFTLGLTDVGEIYFLPELMDALAQTAPAVTLSTVRNTAVNLNDAMAEGKVDLAIGLLPQLKAAADIDPVQQRLGRREVAALHVGGQLHRGRLLRQRRRRRPSPRCRPRRRRRRRP